MRNESEKRKWGKWAKKVFLIVALSLSISGHFKKVRRESEKWKWEKKVRKVSKEGLFDSSSQSIYFRALSYGPAQHFEFFSVRLLAFRFIDRIIQCRLQPLNSNHNLRLKFCDLSFKALLQSFYWESSDFWKLSLTMKSEERFSQEKRRKVLAKKSQEDNWISG